MSSTVLSPSAKASPSSPEGERKTFLNADYGWKSWLFTVDHKKIGVLYLISIMVFFLIGVTFALLMRAELLTANGDLFEAETYNKPLTIHGVGTIFFFLVPSITSPGAPPISMAMVCSL